MDRRDFGRMLSLLAASPVVAPLIGASGEATAAEATRRRDPDTGSSTADSSTSVGAQVAPRWSFTADVAECCSCDIPCSCNFGRPENGTCHGTRLIQIREGRMDGDDLGGIAFVVSFHMGRWTRIYVDRSLTEMQASALDRLLPVAFAGFDRGARAKERVPLTIESSEDTFSFRVPESTIEMKLVPGLDGGPIRIENLPNPAYHDYVQYESVVHEHRSADAEWSYSGTNGFRSVMRVSG